MGHPSREAQGGQRTAISRKRVLSCWFCRRAVPGPFKQATRCHAAPSATSRPPPASRRVFYISAAQELARHETASCLLGTTGQQPLATAPTPVLIWRTAGSQPLVTEANMIRRIQVLNFCCLRYVDLQLDRFHVLIGPNASGKSTLLDSIAFLGDLVRNGLEDAVKKRSANFRDLVWNRRGRDSGFEIAVEIDIPKRLRKLLPREKNFRVFRYQIAVHSDGGGFHISSERAQIMQSTGQNPSRRHFLFPDPLLAPQTILLGTRRGARSVVSKSIRGTDSYYAETHSRAGRGWTTNIALGSLRSTLANLPEPRERFPVSTFFRDRMATGIKRVFLDSEAMRSPSPPHYRTKGFVSDGSSLPWIIKNLRDEHSKDYREWLQHIRTILTDLADIRVVVRPEDRHAYLVLRYDTGVEIPSWTVSGGTMRFLALTLLAYLPANRDIYLVEEPENGIHPLALEGIRDSLWSAYDAQVLATTHSPTLLGLTEPSQVLCFAKNESGATDIVRGDMHPILQEWEGTLDKNVLFAIGIAG